MVSVAPLVPPKVEVIVLRPPAKVSVPMVSVELISAVPLLAAAASAPLKSRVALARETGTVLAMRSGRFAPAPVLSRVRLASVTRTPEEDWMAPSGPETIKLPAVTWVAPV